MNEKRKRMIHRSHSHIFLPDKDKKDETELKRKRRLSPYAFRERGRLLRCDSATHHSSIDGYLEVWDSFQAFVGTLFRLSLPYYSKEEGRDVELEFCAL